MISEFELHALVDGELADEERDRVFEAVGDSVALRAQLDQLQRLKSLMRAGYPVAGDRDADALEMTS